MSLLWGLLIIVVADAIAITAMLLVRRRAPEGSFFTDGDRASGVFGVLATCFAIFAGFVIFLAFTTYDQSLAGAEAEALIVAQQYETAQFLPAETRDRAVGRARLLRAVRRAPGVARDGGRRSGATRSTRGASRCSIRSGARTRRPTRSRRRSPSGSTRRPIAKKHAVTGSTEPPVSRRRRSGSSCS